MQYYKSLMISRVVVVIVAQEVQLLVLVARRYSRCYAAAAARGGVNGDNYWCQDLHLAA